MAEDKKINSKISKISKPKEENIISFLSPYKKWIFGLFIISFISSLGNLLEPRLTGQALDLYKQNNLASGEIILIQIVSIAVVIFVITIIQGFTVSRLSEKVASDIRIKMTRKLAKQSNQFIGQQTTGKILSNFTSDVKTLSDLVSQGVTTTFSAVLLLVGSVISLINLNWYLALWVLSIIPLIVLVFSFIFKTIGKLFKASQTNLDKINRIINESIVAAGLIRVLNSQKSEINKFNSASQVSKELNLKIAYSFAALIPIVNFLSNMATLAIVWFGSNLVVQQELSIGQLSAFISYISLLITPIFLLSFISSTASRAVVSLKRINEITNSETDYSTGEYSGKIKGEVKFKNVNLEIKNKLVLKDINLDFKPKQRIAILGPTGSGKTQLMYLLTALQKSTSGQILIDGKDISEWSPNSLYSQMGLVFQDSLIFSASLLENITLKGNLSDAELDKIISTAQLQDLVASLTDGLKTIISERGSNLSGGQKQRLMLARALAINPKILLLDDFTARVDLATEQTIQKALQTNYPDLTLINITQKIEPVINYDQIILIMEGEIIANGKHEKLLKNSLEYKQIWDSQQSTED
jgi:ATP-binding cassette, subfamily B, bacterial